MKKNEDSVETQDEVYDDAAEETPLVSGKVKYPFPVELFLWGTGIDVLARNFGWNLLMVLFASQHMLKGFVASLVAPCSQFLYASYKVPGPQMQIFGSVASLPWAMKPVIGLFSDAFPIFGYHKAPYILIAAFLGVIACACVGALPQEHLPVGRLVTCLFLLQLQLSTCDLLTEAKYAEKMKQRPRYGPALMTYVWIGIQAGGLLATMMVGPVLKHFGPKVPFIIALIPASLIIVPVLRNHLEEVPKTSEEVAATRRHMLEQREMCALCLMMFVATVTLSILGIHFESPLINAVGAITVAVMLLVAFSVMLRPVIAKVNAFFLLQSALGINIGGAAFYFYTDGPEQYPEGPHFSVEFYTSVLGIIGSCCALLGTWSYQRYASNWSYRELLLVSNLALSIFSLSDIVFFTRLNVKLGIPDHAFVVGSSVLTTVISQWMWMPGVVILSQLCPKGMEATMYALLAGCHNFGSNIASNVGALVLHSVGCAPTGAKGESEQFKNLWMCSALATVLPMLTLLLLQVLIPDAKQTDRLIEDDNMDATQGSLWRRWTERR